MELFSKAPYLPLGPFLNQSLMEWQTVLCLFVLIMKFYSPLNKEVIRSLTTESVGKSHAVYKHLVHLLLLVHLKLFATQIVNTVLDITQISAGPQTFELRCEKTGLRGFRPGLTQTRLCSHTIWLEA